MFLGRDTRESSLRLAEAVTRASKLLSVDVVNYEEVTTPRLHYLVGTEGRISHDDQATALKEFVELIGDAQTQNYEHELVLDCANGVGALTMSVVTSVLSS